MTAATDQARPETVGAAPAGAGPLDGTRVLDFTWNVAGPTCTRILAALGAEVVKVEWPGMPDPGRRLGGAAGGFFANVNLGKRSLTVNAKHPDGRRILAELVGRSDFVVESFSAGTLEAWGFGYERLIALSPYVIYVTVTGFGHTGRYRRYVTYGPTAQAYSGLTYSSGLPAMPPAGWGYSHLDVYTGYMAAAAALAALHKVRVGGGGPQRVDLSQVETGAGLLSDLLLDAQVNGTSYRRPGFPPGNRAVWPGDLAAGGARGEVGAPYGIYRTAGASEDAWCAIAVLSDREWLSLRACLGHPAWATDPGLLAVTGRLARQDELDRRIGEWAVQYDKYELMRMLSRAGVRCGPVQSGRDRLESDPSLRARDVFPEIEMPEIGTYRFESIPIRFDGQPIRPPATWPVLGAATGAVLADVLGYGADEVARLAAAGAIWTAPQDTVAPPSGAGPAPGRRA